MFIGSGVFSFCTRDVVNENHDINMTTILPNLSTRQKAVGENHHLWDNHGSWWFHGTEHRLDGTARRIRLNLRTYELTQARHKRDQILARFSGL